MSEIQYAVYRNRKGSYTLYIMYNDKAYEEEYFDTFSDAYKRAESLKKLNGKNT